MNAIFSTLIPPPPPPPLELLLSVAPVQGRQPRSIIGKSTQFINNLWHPRVHQCGDALEADGPEQNTTLAEATSALRWEGCRPTELSRQGEGILYHSIWVLCNFAWRRVLVSSIIRHKVSYPQIPRFQLLVRFWKNNINIIMWKESCSLRHRVWTHHEIDFCSGDKNWWITLKSWRGFSLVHLNPTLFLASRSCRNLPSSLSQNLPGDLWRLTFVEKLVVM